MTDLLIKKVIAREGEREIIDSSYKEMTQFIAGTSRPEFSRSDVICIKFLFCDSEDLKDAEETCWYINPIFCEKLASIREHTDDSSFDTEESEVYYPDYIFVTTENDAIKMPSNMLPELILMYVAGQDKSIFEQYSLFEAELMRQNLLYAPDTQKYELFLKSFQ